MFAEIKPCTSQNGRGGGIPDLTGTIKSKATTDDFRSILDIVDEEGKQNFSKNVLFCLYSDHQNVSNNLCKVRIVCKIMDLPSTYLYYKARCVCVCLWTLECPNPN